MIHPSFLPRMDTVRLRYRRQASYSSVSTLLLLLLLLRYRLDFKEEEGLSLEKEISLRIVCMGRGSGVVVSGIVENQCHASTPYNPKTLELSSRHFTFLTSLAYFLYTLLYDGSGIRVPVPFPLYSDILKLLTPRQS
jgi:hypothetical protein